MQSHAKWFHRSLVNTSVLSVFLSFSKKYFVQLTELHLNFWLDRPFYLRACMGLQSMLQAGFCFEVNSAENFQNAHETLSKLRLEFDKSAQGDSQFMPP